MIPRSRLAVSTLPTLMALGALLGAAARGAGQAASGPGARVEPANLVRDTSLYTALRYRHIGPYRGGRVTAVTGVPSQSTRFLMGTVGGGVWQSTDAGETWRNLTDGHLDVGPVGAVEVAPSDPSVIYVGTGSGGVRGNVSAGNGVYRSVDGGRSWEHVGLAESTHIHRIVVDPRDPDRVYVTALGHLWGKNPERGVYRSTDGGAHWEKALFHSDSVGAIDLAMNPRNPRVLYAAMWRAERKPWAMISGPTGGVWRTTDGGENWRQLTSLPDSVGRIGLAVSAANPRRVWALVEAPGDRRGLYLSDDAGDSFRQVSDDRNLTARPWYYMHVHAHPTDPDEVYVSGEGFYRSVDGGRSWESIRTPHGDHHSLWINPEDPELMVQGNDGGATVTFNGGETWTTQLNQPTAEFYSVTVDDRFPYRVYGPQQDNSTISLASRVTGGLTHTQDWYAVAGCETGPVAVHPRDSNVVYGACQGQISRLDLSTGQERPIWEWPQEYHGRANMELRYRHQWNSQIEISRHDPSVVYHTSQYVHRTTDGGDSWEVVSPDLTRWDEHASLHETPPGGPLTHDQTGVEIYGTVFALEESPHREGVLWAGSDDGAVHITRDGGGSWTEVTPPEMRLHTTVNQIELSPHGPGRAFVVAHRYRLDDSSPLVWRTNDYGDSWELLTDGSNGVPVDHPTRTLREDPEREGLLYLGTEFGLFVSFDDGGHWQPLQLNLPETPVTDLAVQRGDLVVATQGRGFWILDDLTPLRELRQGVGASDTHLFRPRDPYRVRLAYTGRRGERWPTNPPAAALFTYWLSADASRRAGQPGHEIRLVVSEEDGDAVHTFSSRAEEEEDRLPASAGSHRVGWDLKYPEAFLAPGVDSARSGSRERIQPVTGYTGGPYAVPGSYRVRLVVDGERVTGHSFRIREDPRLADVTVEDMQANFELAIRVRDRISEIQRAVGRIQQVLEELETLRERVDDRPVEARAAAVHDSLEAVAGDLYKHRERGDHAHLHPELTTSYARLGSMLVASDHRPTASARQRFTELEPRFRALMDRADRVLQAEVRDLNDLLRERGVDPVTVPPSSSSPETESATHHSGRGG